MKFIPMVCATFLARVSPVSTSAKPACMNMTRNPVNNVQTTLRAIRLWPTVSITSVSVGFLGSFTVTSFAVPVGAPVGSLRAAGAAAGDAWAWTAGGWISDVSANARRNPATTRPMRPARLLM